MRGPKVILELQRYEDVDDGIGGVTRIWMTIAPVKGVFWHMSGQEQLKYEKITEIGTHGFLFKRNKSLEITNRDQFVGLGTTWDIKHYDDNPLRRDFDFCILKEFNT